MDETLDRILSQVDNLKDLCTEWEPDAPQLQQLIVSMPVSGLGSANNATHSLLKSR